MTGMTASPPFLADRSVITISGPDTREFLQRVITTDMGRLDPDAILPGALLTPQGKIVADFLIHGTDDGVVLEVWNGAADALVKRLSLYRLRAKADIALQPDLAVAAGNGAADPRSAGLPPRSIVERASGADESAAQAEREIAAGVPAFGRDYGEAEVFPTDVNLDVYGGIGWKKGCFVGQEVLSRMKRRGTIRKRSARVTVQNGNLAAGSGLTAGETVIGQLTSVAGNRGIALIRTDRFEKAEMPLRVNGQPVEVMLPAAD